MRAFCIDSFKLKRGVLLCITTVVVISVLSVALTSFDPTAEWDKVIMAVLWLSFLSFATVMLFTHGISLNKTEWVIVFVAWGGRILYATLNNIGVIEFRGDPFFEMAWGLYYGYEHVIDGTYPVITNYPPLLLGEFRIFGINRLVTCYVNAFLTMIAIFYMLKCFKMLVVDRRITSILLAFFSFNPFSILWGSDIFREAVYLPLTALSLYFFIRWTKSKNLLDIFLAMVAILPIVWLHTGYIVIVAVYSFAAFFELNRITPCRLLYKFLLFAAAVAAGIALLILPLAGEYLARFNLLKNMSSFADYFNLVQFDLNSGSGSQYLKWMAGPTSFFKLILYTPARVFLFLYSPMVWDCARVQDIIALITDSVVFLTALVLLCSYIINKKWRQAGYKRYNYLIFATVAVILITAVPFAWGTFNAGTAIRHRNCLLPYICVQIGMLMTKRGTAMSEVFDSQT